MTDKDWEQLRYLKPSEAWGCPQKMDFGLLWLLDSYREYIGMPVIVVCGTQGVHSPKSYHYVGKAVDIVVDAGRLHPVDLMLAAFRFPFTGLGVYPKARYNKFVRPLGFHFDCREVNSLPRGITQAQWLGVPDSSGKMEYSALDHTSLSKYNLT